MTVEQQRTRIGRALAPGRIRRRGWALALACAWPLLGCYSTVPVTGVPATDAVLILDLNDRGRVALGDSIGPSASRVAGELQAVRDSSYVVRVASVQYLNGQSNRWSGEQLTVPMALVRDVRERRFSRARTYGLAAGLVAAVVAVVVGTDLIGGGGEPVGGNPPPPPPDQ